MNSRLLAALAVITSLSGCMSMSGLDSDSKFSCSAPQGVPCQSISAIAAKTDAGTLPFQVEEGRTRKAASVQAYDKAGAQAKVSPKEMPASSSGMPVRQPPLVLRIWMAPFEDESGDLYDQSYMYSMVHSGRWMLEANQKAISNACEPIYPLNENNSVQEGSQDSPRTSSQPIPVPTASQSGQRDNSQE